ncbi:hypothetical protein [uncultured Fretibacterium sp.]|uniref:hypothetical protein n=1 Tax=uncultured Fretibacterium sp. TaxID=1678694 RepID=UPI00262D9E59|nr:hypothetical protein [uncultured Fretibacterium sp.]
MVPHGVRFPGLWEKAVGYVATSGRLTAAGGRIAITLAVLFLLSASSVFAASEDSLPSYLVEKWGSLTETLSDALSLRDRQETLPASSWFGADRTSNARKIDELLDRALEILAQGRAGDLRRQALELRSEIPKLRLEADGLRNQRISAPESSRLPWVKTRAKIDERLSELDGEITDRERALSAVNAQLAEALRELGLQLDDRQIDILLSSVTGDDLLQNAVVFSNVRAMVEKLAELSREDRDNLEINRRYSGLYLVLNDLLIHTQEELVRRIDGEYKPRLVEIGREAEALRREALARGSQAGYSDSQKKSFALNAESNAMTLRVAELYTQLLDSQRKGILDNLADLRRNRDLAENTYRTVRSSGDLRNLIRSGLELFDSIHALSMPEILPFENEAIRREFEEINKRLRH